MDLGACPLPRSLSATNSFWSASLPREGSPLGRVTRAQGRRAPASGSRPPSRLLSPQDRPAPRGSGPPPPSFRSILRLRVSRQQIPFHFGV